MLKKPRGNDVGGFSTNNFPTGIGVLWGIATLQFPVAAVGSNKIDSTGGAHREGFSLN
jgi:hypothetical protein